jgi:phage gpG-like protein
MLARTLKKIRLHTRIMEKIARTLRIEQVKDFNRKFPDFAKKRKNENGIEKIPGYLKIKKIKE